MTIKTWLEIAAQDAERRNLPGLRPLLEALARSTSALRSADWNFDATGESFDFAQDQPFDSAQGKSERAATADAR